MRECEGVVGCLERHGVARCVPCRRPVTGVKYGRGAVGVVWKTESKGTVWLAGRTQCRWCFRDASMPFARVRRLRTPMYLALAENMSY